MSESTEKMRQIASALSYNEKAPEPAAKHMLLAAASELDRLRKPWKGIKSNPPPERTFVLCKGLDRFANEEWIAVLETHGNMWFTSADDSWWGRDDPIMWRELPE